MKKETKIIVIDYPQTFNFVTTKKLPKFKYGCKVRQKLLLEQLENQKIDSPNHAYEDYVIEQVTYGDFMGQFEVWHLGS